MGSARRMTSSEILAGLATPMFDVQFATDGADKGAVYVSVTGVPKAFSLKIPACDVIAAAPFGRPTRMSVMDLAQTTAQQICRQKGFI